MTDACPSSAAQFGEGNDHESEGKWNLDGVRHGFRRLPSLYPWPEQE